MARHRTTSMRSLRCHLPGVNMEATQRRLSQYLLQCRQTRTLTPRCLPIRLTLWTDMKATRKKATTKDHLTRCLFLPRTCFVDCISATASDPTRCRTEHDSADSQEEAEAEDLLVKCIFPNCKKKVVASNEAMSEHIKGVHFKGVRHTAFVACPVDGCDFNPAAVERVTEHICSVKHSAAFGGVDLRPQCDYCSKYFARKSSKTRHRSSDSGGCKVCRFCDSTFESNGQRWAHESGTGAKGCKAVSAAVRKEVKEAEEARLQALSDRRQTRKADNDIVAPARKKRRIEE
ncbi:hypothetical protein DFH11DRAFT_1577421, partial [Phellopilus nigrolimitatus]